MPLRQPTKNGTHDHDQSGGRVRAEWNATHSEVGDPAITIAARSSSENPMTARMRKKRVCTGSLICSISVSDAFGQKLRDSDVPGLEFMSARRRPIARDRLHIYPRALLSKLAAL